MIQLQITRVLDGVRFYFPSSHSEWFALPGEIRNIRFKEDVQKSTSTTPDYFFRLNIGENDVKFYYTWVTTPVTLTPEALRSLITIWNKAGMQMQTFTAVGGETSFTISGFVFGNSTIVSRGGVIMSPSQYTAPLGGTTLTLIGGGLPVLPGEEFIIYTV